MFACAAIAVVIGGWGSFSPSKSLVHDGRLEYDEWFALGFCAFLLVAGAVSIILMYKSIHTTASSTVTKRQ